MLFCLLSVLNIYLRPLDPTVYGNKMSFQSFINATDPHHQFKINVKIIRILFIKK